MKIGILYIAIGKYSTFFKDFYETCEKYFLPNSKKEYYIFTDNDLEEYYNFSNIKIIKEKDYGWPGNTLYRFHMFKKVENLLKENNFLFFFNSNYKFINYIYENEILKKDILINLFWKKVNEKPRHKFSYDRNPKSQAFIDFDQGNFYYQGGMNGGKTELYFDLINNCIEMIEKDKKINYIPLHNDECYINKYYLHKKIFLLDENYGMPEEWGISPNVKAILQDKNRVLGIENIKKQKKELYGKNMKRYKKINKIRYIIFKIKNFFKI